MWIYKFIKNCCVGDMLIIGDGDAPMFHCYEKVVELHKDHVLTESGYKDHKSIRKHNHNTIVKIRPLAPKSILPEIHDEHYGADGHFPWPYDVTKTAGELLLEIGEDKSCLLFQKWWYEMYKDKWNEDCRLHNEGRSNEVQPDEPFRITNPELTIRRAHERAIRHFYQKESA